MCNTAKDDEYYLCDYEEPTHNHSSHNRLPPVGFGIRCRKDCFRIRAARAVIWHEVHTCRPAADTRNGSYEGRPKRSAETLAVHAAVRVHADIHAVRPILHGP